MRKKRPSADVSAQLDLHRVIVRAAAVAADPGPALEVGVGPEEVRGQAGRTRIGPPRRVAVEAGVRVGSPRHVRLRVEPRERVDEVVVAEQRRRVERGVARARGRDPVEVAEVDGQGRGARAGPEVPEGVAAAGRDVGEQVLLGEPELVQEAVRLDVDLVDVEVGPEVASARPDVARFESHVPAELALEAGAPGLGIRRLQVGVEDRDVPGDDVAQRIGRLRGHERRGQACLVAQQHRRRSQVGELVRAVRIDRDAGVGPEDVREVRHAVAAVGHGEPGAEHGLVAEQLAEESLLDGRPPGDAQVGREVVPVRVVGALARLVLDELRLLPARGPPAGTGCPRPRRPRRPGRWPSSNCRWWGAGGAARRSAARSSGSGSSVARQESWAKKSSWRMRPRAIDEPRYSYWPLSLSRALPRMPVTRPVRIA